ncbi:MAG: hypothetical protein ACP5M0_15935, partial [Desulfomonilaceae bacterium]
RKKATANPLQPETNNFFCLKCLKQYILTNEMKNQSGSLTKQQSASTLRENLWLHALTFRQLIG